MLAFFEFVPQERRLNCCSCISAGRTKVGTTQWPFYMPHVQCCPIHCTVPTSHPAHYCPFGPLERKPARTTLHNWRCTAERHARVTAEERENFTVGDDIVLLKDGRRLSTKMGSLLKNNCAFSNAVVKFCEVFTCATPE